jgi:diguanylate cyclase (GGDEF)-like protein
VPGAACGSPAPTAAVTPAAEPRGRGARLLWAAFEAVAGADPRLRISTTQWMITVPVYCGSALVYGLGAVRGWISMVHMVAWSTGVGLALAGFYVALRSGWSARFKDPTLTFAQIVFAVIAVDWGYFVTGPLRTATLFPLLLVLTFGSFSLPWRRIVSLTVFTLFSFAATVYVLHLVRSGGVWSLADPALRVDLINLGMVMVLLPAVSLVAVRLSSLRRRLRAERTALQDALREVQRLATRDELTGLANRRHMQQLLAAEEGRFKRCGHAFSVAVIDLDHFKRINDLHGHATGDQVLRKFAAQAGDSLRGHDVLARWGGEEFLLLMPYTRAEQATTTVQRLLASMRDLSTDAGAMSFSAGVAEFGQGDTMSCVLARADEAMYAAKQAGRNMVMQG